MQLTSIAVLEERVKRGAQLLDINCPGWAGRIDISDIDVACPLHSVTGQLFGPSVEEQFSGVGMNYDDERPWEAGEKFAECGFAVLIAEAVQVPEEIRRRMEALASDLSALVGRDMSAAMKAPEVLPLPRDPDRVRAEAFTVDELWRRATLARR